MNKNNQNSWLSISEASRYLRVSKDTLRRWEKKGILKPHRSPTNRRFYKKRDLENLFSMKEEIKEDQAQTAPSKRNNRFALIIICLFTTFIIIAAFFAFIVLQTTS